MEKIGKVSYNFRIRNDLLAVRMEDAVDVLIELVKLMNWRFRTNIPENSVIQYKMITWVECRYIFHVSICVILIIECPQ